MAESSLIHNDPTVVQGHGSSLSITERGEADAIPMLEGEELSQSLLANAAALIWISDPNRKRVQVSRGWVNFSGKPPEEQLGDGWIEFIHPEDRARLLEQCESACASRQSLGVEYRGRRADGEYRWLQDSGEPRFHADGTFAGYVCWSSDITERKCAEEALRESRERNRVFFASSAFGVFVAASDFQFLEANPAFQGMVGYTAEELRRLRWSDITHSDDLASEMAWARGLWTDPGHRGTIQYEKRYLHRQGHAVWVRVSLEPLHDDRGQPLHTLAIVEDLSAKKRAEAERRQLDEQIHHAQRLESLGVLVGSIGHDFGNLLTGILGYTGMALLDLPLGSALAPLLEQVETAAQRAATLTQQLLGLARRSKGSLRHVDLSTVVREMLGLAHSTASRMAEIIPQLAEGLPAVEVEVSQFRQVLLNLIANASDSLDEKPGQIVIRTGLRHLDNPAEYGVCGSANLPRGDYVTLEVSDTGRGMTPATIARIFEPFFTTGLTGEGLGLAAVLGIVRGHRGAIKVTSTPGQGSTFEVLLPSVEQVTPAGARTSSAAAPYRGKGTLLVLEDEEGIRMLARLVFVQAGFRVLLAKEGQEGIDIFHRHRSDIDAVLLDLNLPRLSGIDAVRAIRQLSPDIPILLMSGLSVDELMRKYRPEGVTGFIQKPFTPSHLLTVLQHVLARSATPAQS